MNVPERLWEANYKDLSLELKRPIHHYVASIHHLLQRGVGFWIFGPAGTGKTCGGIVLLKAGWEHGHVGYYTTVKELRQSLKENEDFDSSESIMSRVRAVDILVIDDLASDDYRNFTFGISDVEHLLKSRSSRGKTTILSTRLGPDDLSVDYPSILHSMRGTFHAISCAGARQDEASIQLRKDLGG
jgi:DNA replication protein DnaC